MFDNIFITFLKRLCFLSGVSKTLVTHLVKHLVHKFFVFWTHLEVNLLFSIHLYMDLLQNYRSVSALPALPSRHSETPTRKTIFWYEDTRCKMRFFHVLVLHGSIFDRLRGSLSVVSLFEPSSELSRVLHCDWLCKPTILMENKITRRSFQVQWRVTLISFASKGFAENPCI